MRLDVIQCPVCPIKGRRANIGMSPSGKAPDFDSGIRRFKSCHPSQRPASSVGRAIAF